MAHLLLIIFAFKCCATDRFKYSWQLGVQHRQRKSSIDSAYARQLTRLAGYTKHVSVTLAIGKYEVYAIMYLKTSRNTTFAKYATQLNELHGHIIKACTTIIAEQQSHFALTAKIQELENECVRLKNWSTEKERYSRQQIASGIFAYLENDRVGCTQESHKLCCNCFDNTIHSTLQQQYTRAENYSLVCPKGCPPLKFRMYKEDIAIEE